MFVDVLGLSGKSPAFWKYDELSVAVPVDALSLADLFPVFVDVLGLSGKSPAFWKYDELSVATPSPFGPAPVSTASGVPFSVA